MTRINVRAKGARAELEVAKIIQAVVDKVALQCGYVAPTIRRNVEQCQIGGEDLVGLPWYSFEIKRCERVELTKWWEQTLAQAGRKAAGSSAWDALVKGGWRKVAAGVPVVGPAASLAVAQEVGGGSVALGQGEAARGASDEAEAARVGSGEVGSAPLAGGGSGLVVEAVGLPVPAWLRGWSWVETDPSKPFLHPLEAPNWGDPRENDRKSVNPVPSPLVAGPALGGPLDLPTIVSPCKVPPMAREPVLIWRQNKQPWNVRCVVDIACPNALKVRSVVDLTLDSWLEVLAIELGHRLKG